MSDMNLELISRTAGADAGKPSLLFIHGGFHGAWCWDEHFLPWFNERGWAAHAVSLRGHGLSDGAAQIKDWSLADYAEDVLSMITRLGRPVILIGHSMGGVVAQQCWREHDFVRGMVLVASSPLRPSRSVIYRLMRANPVSLILGQVLKDPVRLQRAMVPFLLSPYLSPDKRESYHTRLCLESPKAMAEIFSRPPPDVDASDCPVHVIAGADDWSIPLSDNEGLAATYQTELEVCPGWHDLMLDPEWEASAQSIQRWLEQNFKPEKI